MSIFAVERERAVRAWELGLKWKTRQLLLMNLVWIYSLCYPRYNTNPWFGVTWNCVCALSERQDASKISTQNFYLVKGKFLTWVSWDSWENWRYVPSTVVILLLHFVPPRVSDKELVLQFIASISQHHEHYFCYKSRWSLHSYGIKHAWNEVYLAF